MRFIYFSLLPSTATITGSHIRGAVALTPFDDFHRHSSTVIQMAVFGKDANGQLNTYLKFDVNNLVSI